MFPFYYPILLRCRNAWALMYHPQKRQKRTNFSFKKFSLIVTAHDFNIWKTYCLVGIKNVQARLKKSSTKVRKYLQPIIVETQSHKSQRTSLKHSFFVTRWRKHMRIRLYFIKAKIRSMTQSLVPYLLLWRRSNGCCNGRRKRCLRQKNPLFSSPIYG